MKIKETSDGLVLEVLVKPRSKSCRIEISNMEVLFFCKKPPIKGKVNKELIKAFSNLFGSEVKIVAGLSSNQKMVLLKDIDKLTFEQKIKSTIF
jgi:uncharacterized protein (TIGR00251 family)